jgi:hypothetical protein
MLTSDNEPRQPSAISVILPAYHEIDRWMDEEAHMKRRIGIIHLSKFQKEKTGNWLTKHFVFEQHKRAVCHSMKNNSTLNIIDNILAYE